MRILKNTYLIIHTALLMKSNILNNIFLYVVNIPICYWIIALVIYILKSIFFKLIKYVLFFSILLIIGMFFKYTVRG